MGVYSIWQIRGNGTARWISGHALGASAADALEKAAGLIPAPEGSTFFVVNPTANPNGNQALFRLETKATPKPPLRAVSVSLDS